MFIVKYDNDRDVDEGQYFVELTKNRELDIANCDRLGYWCDKAHLKHFLLEILRHFNGLELIEILQDQKR